MLEDRFYEVGVVPVVVMEDADRSEALAEALCSGGLPCAEVTFRTGAAAETISRMKAARPDMLVGAGTVLSALQVDDAKSAGAEFIVSPGFDPDVVSHCMDIGIPVIPGTMTPSEMQMAVKYGLETVKFFPAEPAGGIKMIKALASPFSMLRFMPTGGINYENASAYLNLECVIACGGSWMVKRDDIARGDFAKIRQLACDAAELVSQIRKK